MNKPRFTASIGDGRDGETKPYKTTFGAARAALKKAPPGHIRLVINENDFPLFVIHAYSPENAITELKQALARTRR